MKNPNDELFEEQEGEERVPHAGLAKTLASALNYTFEVAVADLIDNSIANGAKNVWIYIDNKEGKYESERAFVAVVDDGNGLSNQSLIDKLEYGFKSEENSKNLGAFGLGLKTAASSQSWIVAVATRESSKKDFFCRAWDIPWLDENDGSWKLKIPKRDLFPSKILEPIKDSSGTVVLLPDLKRMKANMDELSSFNQSQVLNKKSKDCKKYLGIVFHRFISGKCLSDDYSGSKLNIFLNDEKIKPWDPFMETHKNHKRFSLGPNEKLKHLTAKTNSNSEVLSLCLYGLSLELRLHILPKLEQGTKEFKDGSGINGWNAHQGVYFYRLDRLIQMGGWCGLQKNDEHNKLARMSIDVGREWDSLIELTAVKDRVIIPEIEGNTFRNDFRKIFSKLRAAAKIVYNNDTPIVEDESLDDNSEIESEELPPEGGNQEPDAKGGSNRTGGFEPQSTGDSGSNESENTDDSLRPGPTNKKPRKLDEKTIESLLDACENEKEKGIITKVWSRARKRGL